MSPEVRAAMMFAGTILAVLAWLVAHSEREECDEWNRK